MRIVRFSIQQKKIFSLHGFAFETKCVSVISNQESEEAMIAVGGYSAHGSDVAVCIFTVILSTLIIVAIVKKRS